MKREYTHFEANEVQAVFQPSKPMVILRLIKDEDFDPPQYIREIHPVVGLVWQKKRSYYKCGDHETPLTGLHEIIVEEGWILSDSVDKYQALCLEPEFGYVDTMDCLDCCNTVQRLALADYYDENIWLEMQKDLDIKRPNKSKEEINK